jgi:large subunit ribosomal protein L6
MAENNKFNKKKEIKENIIEVPSDINVTFDGAKIILEKAGNKREVKFNPVYVSVDLKDNNLIIMPVKLKKKNLSVSNTIKKIIENTINGFDKEYIYKLAIVFSHFPISIKVQGKEVMISNFLGEKKPRKTKILPNCKIEINGKDIVVRGHDKYAVGQTAGNLESTARVTKRDYRVFDDGIYITEKNTKE